MKKVLIPSLVLLLLAVAGCHKPDKTNTIVTEQQVLTDFAGKLANPNYQDIQSKANDLNTAVTAFNASPTAANLSAAQQKWRDVRAAWESCESYLFGPVEDDNYDPSMDTWPLNKTELDSLLLSSNGLTVSDINGLPESLKGFHAIEYVLFGSGSAAQVAADSRKMLYVVSLTQSLYTTTTALRDSWDPTQGNYTAKLVTAGTAGNTAFPLKKDAFLAISNAMSGICDEVANGKMEDPLGPTAADADSTLVESRFSHNSTTDFTNNIKGVQNAYVCQYGSSTGASLHNLIAQKNSSLDNRVTTKITAAIAAMGTIDLNYETAIYTQRTQIKAAQDAINELKDLIDNELTPFIQNNITD